MAIDVVTYNTATDAQDLATQSLANARPWQRNTTYQVGDVCVFSSNFWLNSMSHTSGTTFDTGYWQQLNSDANRIQGHLVELGALVDGAVLSYNLSTNKFESRVINNTGTGSSSTINDNATLGNTTVTFSADKILSLLNAKVSNGSISLVATTGNYSDLNGKPSIPQNISQLTNDLNYITLTQLNNGLANKVDLVGGKIPTSVLPALAITDTFTANSDSAMTQLVAQTGDICIRPDKPATYILVGTDSSVLSNWTVLPTPTGSVQSVNGQTGVIVLNSDNIAQGTTNLYVTSTEKSTWNNKLDKVTSPVIDNIVTMNSDGTLKNSGKKISEIALSGDLGNKTSLLTDSKTDLVSAINEVFNFGVNFKTNMAQAINSKNTTPPVSSNSNQAEFITAINNIPSSSFSGSNVVEITKLNVTGSVATPYTKTVNLINPINDKLILTGVREFISSSASTQLVSTFDNSDSSAFVANSKVIYDGSMHLVSNNINNANMSNSGAIGSGIEWTYDIDRTQFNSIDSISVQDGTIPTINITGTYKPQIITTTSDIDLSNIDAINSIIFNNTTSNGGQCLLAISCDGGIVYKAYSQASGTWVTIDTTNVGDFASKGMSKGLTDILTSTQLEVLRSGSKKIRFAYYLSLVDALSVANNQDISLNLQVSGHHISANKTDYDVVIGSDNQSIQFKVYKNGTFSFNYINN